jgi:hypothetical protein
MNPAVSLRPGTGASPVPEQPTAPASLEQACRALWLATLSLMAAFMHQPAPAHRHLLARRIARNLATLAEQPCFTADTRGRFARLAARWEATAMSHRPDAPPVAGGMWQAVLRFVRQEG